MKRKEVLIAAVFGGCFGALVTMLVGLFAPMGVVAQNQDAVFGKITCTGIEVVDSSGEGRCFITIGEHGGFVSVYGKGEEWATMGMTEHGGRVGVFGKGEEWATMGMTEHGGVVSVLGKGEGRAEMSMTEHGGSVGVFGKGEGKAGMGINEYGNGGISTWDKNGYRQ